MSIKLRIFSLFLTFWLAIGNGQLSDAQVVGSEALKEQANASLFRAVTGGNPKQEMLDLYAISAHAEISFSCGEFLSGIEALGLANAQISIFFTWTEDTLRNYADYAELTRDNTATGTEQTLGVAKLFAPTAITGVLSADIRSHTRKLLDSGCNSRTVTRLADAIQAHVRLRFLEGAQDLYNILSGEEAQLLVQAEPFPCPDFSRDCFSNYGTKQISDLVSDGITIYNAEFAFQPNEITDTGFGLVGWMTLVSQNGEKPELVPPLSPTQQARNAFRFWDYKALRCYVARAEEECAPFKTGFEATIQSGLDRGSLEFPRRFFSSVAPYMLLTDGYEDAKKVYDQIGEDGVHASVDKRISSLDLQVYLHFAANRIRAGDQDAAYDWLQRFKARSVSESEDEIGSVPALAYDIVRNFADRFQTPLTEYTTGWGDDLVNLYMQVHAARGLADKSKSKQLCDGLIDGRYNTKTSRGYDLADRMLGLCAQTHAALKDRASYDQTLVPLSRMSNAQLPRARAYAAGAIAFGDQVLMEKIMVERSSVPRTATYVLDDIDRELAQALAANGEINLAWETANRMVHPNNELWMKFQIVQALL